jgi:hypothetical protein
MKTTWHWHKNRHETNETEDSDKNLCRETHWTFLGRMHKETHWKLFNNNKE